jgi:ribosomal protein S6--L-glutamate ligase
MLQSKRGPLVLEVNSSPGLEGIEKATKLDIAGRIIVYTTHLAVKKKAKPKAKKDPGHAVDAQSDVPTGK